MTLIKRGLEVHLGYTKRFQGLYLLSSIRKISESSDKAEKSFTVLSATYSDKTLKTKDPGTYLKCDSALAGNSDRYKSTVLSLKGYQACIYQKVGSYNNTSSFARHISDPFIQPVTPGEASSNHSQSS